MEKCARLVFFHSTRGVGRSCQIGRLFRSRKDEEVFSVRQRRDETASEKKFTRMNEKNDDDIDERERAFHGAIREYVVCLLIFLGLYGLSHAIVRKFKKRSIQDDLYSGDEGDYLVYRISVWICTFSFAVSIAAVLLVPFSIFSNEILLLYPRSYYMQWLNSSLVRSLWNYVFLCNNLCLFFLLPFAYFFIESQGFSGLRKGVLTRVYESTAVLALSIILILCLARLMAILFDDARSRNESLLTVHLTGAGIWNYQVPFVYSCVSLFGVAMTLTCTPFGFSRMFAVLGELVVKPRFRRDIEAEMAVVEFECATLERSLKTGTNGVCPRSRSYPNGFDKRNINNNNSDDDFIVCSRGSSPGFGCASLISSMLSNHDGSSNRSFSEVMQKLDLLNALKYELERQRRSWLWLNNLKYPIAMVLLLVLTGISVLMVTSNSLQLIIGLRTLPAAAETLELGNTSLSALGPIGAVIEVIIILYLMIASLVGFYSFPFLNRLKPVRRQTSMTKLICNCIAVLILSSALPVLARTLGISNFDLLGNYGRLNWLGNFRIVLSYNLIFASATALCLVTKFTATVRKEIMKRFGEAGVQLRRQRWQRQFSTAGLPVVSFDHGSKAE